VIAAFIIWLTQSNGELLSQHTFQILVLASIVPAFLAVIVMAIWAKDVSTTGKAKFPVLSLKGIDNRFKVFLLVVVLFTLGNSSDAFIILRGQERGLTVLEIMGMLIAFNAIYASWPARSGLSPTGSAGAS